MTTFSDLMTLLLTFFVLLVSMSSMDVKTVQQAFNRFTGGSGPLEFREKGQLEELVSLISPTSSVSMQMLMENKKAKDIIFSFDNLGYQRIMDLLKKDIKVEITEKGLAIQLSNYILFDEGVSGLRLENLPLLHRLAEVIRAVGHYPISIEGHTDGSPAEGGSGELAWRLSLARAINVLEYFTEKEGLPSDRFRIGGFGPSKPIYPVDVPESKIKNRRIEIVIYKEQLG
ncbi:MAG: flagellar motor protein MotB [Deltaproteobacteria bacterium]|nr:flagellar motor protein MotB [Deltaproteobacteria bacterium]MBW2140062.1 flagellar motor protein MotB [Deltaproteobacteria bacterium]MBW2322072.1 flagellar motor protein MotB [Deltaproteobacteria bacterium]